MKCRISNEQNPTLLIYNADENKAALESIAEKICARAVFVPKDECSLPLAEIIEGRKIAQNTKDEPLFSEPMIIMHETDVDLTLKLLREGGIKIGLKAITTPHNLRWSANTVYKHLSAERAAFQAQK